MTSKSEQRIREELSNLETHPLKEASIGPVDDNMFHWEGFLYGPIGSVYEDGIFNISIDFPSNYPSKPPAVKFLTKVYHPNIGETSGEICVDILKNQWTSVDTISQVMLSISSLLTDPNPSSPLNGQSARLYETDRVAYNAKVRQYVKKFANSERLNYYKDARENQSSPESEDNYNRLRSSPSSDSPSDSSSDSSDSYQSEQSGSGSTGQTRDSSTPMDVNLVSGYHMPTNSFTLQCFVQSSQSSHSTSQRIPFTALLKYDFQKTVWFSHITNTPFLSHCASISSQQQFFTRTGECGHHLYLSNHGVLSVIYCHKEGNGLKADIPVPLNEIMPKMRAKELQTHNGAKQVLVVGRKADINRNGEQRSSHSSSDQPMRANLNQLPSKSFGIYVEDDARLIVLDQSKNITNVRHHNHTLVTGGGFLLVEGELFMAFPSIGFGMYSAKQLEDQQVFSANEISGKRNPVLFLQAIRSQHHSLCWGLVVTKHGEMCLIIPDNGEFFVENYDSKGIYDVMHRHASKPWSSSVQYDYRQ